MAGNGLKNWVKNGEVVLQMDLLSFGFIKGTFTQINNLLPVPLLLNACFQVASQP